MPARTTVFFATAGLFAAACGAGLSVPWGGDAGSSGHAAEGGFVGADGGEVDGGGSTASGSSTAATGDAASPPGTDGSTAAADGATAADAGPASTAGDAAGVDAGSQPYKGVALLEGNPDTCPDIATLKLSWYYNWTIKTGCRTAVPFVPQIWGHPSEPIASEIAQIVAAGHHEVLGFNEPDNTGQSNMSVATAISLWPALDDPALRVGSPATSANSAGQAWFEQFMTQAAAQSLRVDFIAVHWYGWNAGSCDAKAAALESYVKWAEQWNRPIWITEWGCLNMSAPTAQTVQAFYDGAVTMLRRHPLVERYGWFLSRNSDNTALIDSTSVALTALGTDYAAAPSVR